MNQILVTFEYSLRAIPGLDPEWADEAVAYAALVPHQGSDEEYLAAVVSAAYTVIQPRLAALEAHIHALNKQTNTQIAMNAAIAACEAMPDRGIRH